MKLAPCCCKLSAEESAYFWRLLNGEATPEASFRAVDDSVCEDSYERLVRERGSAFHESGHAIAAHAAGAKILAVAIGEHPVALSAYPAEAPILLRLIGIAAGHVCEGLASAFGPPPREALAGYVANARAGATGGCDECKSARILCDAFPALSDEELVTAWLSTFELTRRLFLKPPWRKALHSIAGALRDRTRLTGEDIAAIVDADALRAAQAEVLAGVDANNPNTWGLLQ